MSTDEGLTGRDLDAEIARRVFGHHVPDDWEGRLAVPPYSSDIAHAWRVVDRMKELSLQPLRAGRHRETMDEGIAVRRRFLRELGNETALGGLMELMWLNGKAAALKICRAALAAVGDGGG